MALHPAMQIALNGVTPSLATLVEIQFADRTVRISDGIVITWGVNVFTPEDPEIGTLNGFSGFTEMEGTESPRLEVSFEYKTNAALTRLATPSSQGTPFNIYMATIDQATGNVIGAPELMFAGQIDDGELRHERNNRMLTISLSTAWELLFDNDEGLRWDNNTWFDAYGSRAFYAVTDVQRKLYWGYKGPAVGGGGSMTSGGGWIDNGNGGNVVNQLV